MISQEKSEVWLRKFLIIQETINGELRKSPMSTFYLNSVDRRDLMSIRSVQCANMATAHALVCVTQLPYGGHPTSLAL